MPSSIELKKILSGIPQTLISKFVIDPSLILNIFQSFNENSNENVENYINKSMLFDKIKQECNGLYREKEELENKIKNKYNSLLCFNCDIEKLEKYIELKNSIQTLNNKKRKNAYREMENIANMLQKKPEIAINTYESYLNFKKDLDKLENIIQNSSNYITNTINNNIQELVKFECLEIVNDQYKITLFGEISAKIKEAPGILLGYLLFWNNSFENLSLAEIVGFLSIFTSIKVPEDLKIFRCDNVNENLNHFITLTKELYYDKYQDLYIDEFQYDIVEEVIDWVNAETEEECKAILYRLENEKQVFTGEFVKALLKINHISLELETVSEFLGNVKLTNIFNKIPKETLKYVATNQSLYV